MNYGDLVYIKSQSANSGSESSSAWDDKRLRDAYDRATKIADEMVAKRVAMETNSTHKDKIDTSSLKKQSEKKSKSKKGNKWSVGKSCRATYEDGQEYEAVITDIIDEFECVVKYLGYDNSEVVLLNSLKPSKGSKEIAQQIAQAAQENDTDGASETDPTNNYSVSDSTPRPMKKKKTHKKNKLKLPNFPNLPMLPNLPMNMPMDMPIAPPMPFPTSSDVDEQQTLSSMLLSWYLSGYYCGLYQGINQAKKRR